MLKCYIHCSKSIKDDIHTNVITIVLNNIHLDCVPRFKTNYVQHTPKNVNIQSFVDLTA